MNRTLTVDLTHRNYEVENISQSVLDSYLGGRGLGAYLLYKTMKKGTGPLSPDNILIFSCGPLQGTNAYYSSRVILNTKSPLTGIYLYSVASGNLGHEIKKAGYVALVIKGRSFEPTFLSIKDDKVEFRSARKLWGLKTIEAQEAMLKEIKMPKASCACIGPAGEKLQKMAVIATGGENVRTFGRGGPGAVMGSKNLKGVVVSGSKEIEIADQGAFDESKRIIRENVKKNAKWADNWQRFGSTGDTMSLNELGILPTKNWRTGMFGGIQNIALTQIENIWPRKNVSCGPYCINPCAYITEIDRGPWEGTRIEGPEFETIYAFGSNCGVDQFDAIVKAQRICDEYGIDTISCGAAIGFAMECYETGLLNDVDTGGIELRFGNSEAMVKAVEVIAKGEGVGVLLGEGVKRVSEKIPGSAEFAMHCKGLEFGGYECRGMWGQALEFALASRGGCHHAYGLPARTPSDQEAGNQLDGKGNLVKNVASARILYDCSILCSFTRVAIGADNENLTRMINAVTGGNYTVTELMKIGFRVMNLERMFNVREGLGRKDDYLPQRLTKEPLLDGPRKGSVIPMDDLLDEGYQALGWDKDTGVPTRNTLASLGLSDLCL